MRKVRSTPLLSLATSFLCFFVFTTHASAYAGLGPLIPMIGNGIVLLFMFAVTALGIISYPARALFRKFFKRDKDSKNIPRK